MVKSSTSCRVSESMNTVSEEMRSFCKPSSSVLFKVTLSVWSNMLPSPSWFVDQAQFESLWVGSPLRYQSQGGMTKVENVHTSVYKFYKQFCQLLQERDCCVSAGTYLHSSLESASIPSLLTVDFTSWVFSLLGIRVL